MKEKNKLFIPYVITLIGTIMMFLLLVLPFTTATDEYAERLDRFADTEVCWLDLCRSNCCYRLIFFDSGNKSYSKKAYRYHNINDFYGDNRWYF